MSVVKRIRLTMNVPVEARHGMKKGTVHDVLPSGQPGDSREVWVQGDGERVKLLSGEWEPYTEVAQ